MSDYRADILAMTRTRHRLSQPQRVELILSEGVSSARSIILDETPDLFGTPNKAINQVQADIAKWEAQGYTVTSILDPTYPHDLLSIREAPALIYT